MKRLYALVVASLALGLCFLFLQPPAIAQLPPAGGVTTFSAGTTGLTPSTPTRNAVVLGGTLAKGSGGTGGTTGQGAAANLSIPYVQCHTSTDASVTGTVSETILGWCNVPAAVLGTSGCILPDLSWSFTAGGAAANWSQIIRIVAGTSNGTTSGTGLANTTMTQPQAGRWAYKICNNNSASSQWMLASSPPFGANTQAYATAAINTANAFTISFNATLGNAGDTVHLKGHTETVIQSAGN